MHFGDKPEITNITILYAMFCRLNGISNVCKNQMKKIQKNKRTFDYLVYELFFFALLDILESLPNALKVFLVL